MFRLLWTITIIVCGAKLVFATEKCPRNERTTSCIQAKCERRDCSDLLKPVACVRIDPKFCTDGCLCVDGYLRTENGTCVPINQCPEAKCKDNEIFDACPSTCPGEQCGVDPRLVLCAPNPEPGDPSCQPRCRCADGYLRNDNSKCIPKDKCLNCFGQNEVRGCKSVRPQTCESIEKTYPIDKITRISVCIPECRCKEGYFRNKIDQCISREDCLKCTGPNEYFSCGGACDNVCATLHKQSQTKCPIVNIVCNKMCYCEKGYARDNNNICVPISQCPQYNKTNNGSKEFE